MKVLLPNRAIPETQYAMHCLLGEFLGLQYETATSTSQQDFCIEVNGRQLVIKNHFFHADETEVLYRNERLPQQLHTSVLKIGEKQLPIHSLYGEAVLEEKPDGYFLHADIIAATFFMLSRWEEAIVEKRDAHGRFRDEESIAHQFGLTETPIVNEYVEILWALLQALGVQQQRKARKFSLLPTHDVDYPFMFHSAFATLRSIIGPFSKPKTFVNGIRYIRHLLNGTDPYDTHGLFMDLAEKAGVQAHFFFIAGGSHQRDPTGLLAFSKTRHLLENIKQRGHGIGFHPSYSTCHDPMLFQKEKEQVEMVSEQPILTGRQHYLRFQVPGTWRMWEENGMEWDSTMGFPTMPGFRCGVCYPFPVFDVFARKQLKLVERPLLVMEVTLINHLKMSPRAALEKVGKVIETVRAYQGEFVFLWHNSSVVPAMYRPYMPVLKRMYGLGDA